MPVTLYGISNCDTVKKARKWLDSHEIDYQFVDFRKTPLTAAQLAGWAGRIGWETLLNKRSRTWRELDQALQAEINEARALKLMHQQPTLIKRPVLVADNCIITGFDSARYEELF